MFKSIRSHFKSKFLVDDARFISKYNFYVLDCDTQRKREKVVLHDGGAEARQGEVVSLQRGGCLSPVGLG